ncbi:MAG: L,D-transpeptidase family protein [Pseudomonadota bacterium]
MAEERFVIGKNGSLVAAVALGAALGFVSPSTHGLAIATALAQSAQPAAEATEQSAAEQKPLSPLMKAIQREAALSTQARVLMDFYRADDAAPIWVSDSGPSDKAADMVAALKTAGEHGLNPNEYGVGALDALLTATDEASLAELEVGLSTGLINFTRHLYAGRVSPSSINKDLHIDPEPPNFEEVLGGAINSPDLGNFVESWAPRTPRYFRMKNALKAYRALESFGEWPTVPDGEALKPGMDDPVRVPALQARLEHSGILPRGLHEGTVYDGVIVDVVKAFQQRHGLATDGVIGPDTYTELNTPIAERVRQIEINMERRRWMSDDPGRFYIFVNIADQMMRVTEDLGYREKTIHTARVVIGKPYRRTPVFTDKMEYIVVNPTWNVPRSIAVRDFLPKLKKNPNALSPERFRFISGGGDVNPRRIDFNRYTAATFPFRIQERPGPHNALGRIKFMFPNEFAVYIHDTPSKALFDRDLRVFSSGCIRVEDPMALANLILGREGVGASRVQRVLDSGRETRIDLQNEVPVHITYITSWVNKDGTPHFRRDPYDRDASLSEALTDATGL